MVTWIHHSDLKCMKGAFNRNQMQLYFSFKSYKPPNQALGSFFITRGCAPCLRTPLDAPFLFFMVGNPDDDDDD